MSARRVLYTTADASGVTATPTSKAKRRSKLSPARGAHCDAITVFGGSLLRRPRAYECGLRPDHAGGFHAAFAARADGTLTQRIIKRWPTIKEEVGC